VVTQVGHDARSRQLEPCSVQNIFCRIFCSLFPQPSFWLPTCPPPPDLLHWEWITYVKILLKGVRCYILYSTSSSPLSEKTLLKTLMVVLIKSNLKKKYVNIYLNIYLSQYSIFIQYFCIFLILNTHNNNKIYSNIIIWLLLEKKMSNTTFLHLRALTHL